MSSPPPRDGLCGHYEELRSRSPSGARDSLLTALLEGALRRERREGVGVGTRYAAAFDEGADGLLVITVLPKR